MKGKNQTLLQGQELLLASLRDLERHSGTQAGEHLGVVVHNGDGFAHDLSALQFMPLIQAGARRGQEVEAREEHLVFTARFQQEQLHNKLQRKEQLGQKELFDRRAAAKTW